MIPTLLVNLKKGSKIRSSMPFGTTFVFLSVQVSRSECDPEAGAIEEGSVGCKEVLMSNEKSAELAVLRLRQRWVISLALDAISESGAAKL
jgi:hypothetical protein